MIIDPVIPPSDPTPTAPAAHTGSGTASVIAGAATALGGIAVTWGTIAPWLTDQLASGSGYVQSVTTVNGLDRGGDGNMILPLGACLLVLGVIRCMRDHWALQGIGLLLAIAAVAITSGDVSVVQNRIDTYSGTGNYYDGFETLWWGPGITIIIVGGVLAGLASMAASYGRYK